MKTSLVKYLTFLFKCWLISCILDFFISHKLFRKFFFWQKRIFTLHQLLKNITGLDNIAEISLTDQNILNLLYFHSPPLNCFENFFFCSLKLVIPLLMYYFKNCQFTFVNFKFYLKDAQANSPLPSEQIEVQERRRGSTELEVTMF